MLFKVKMLQVNEAIILQLLNGLFHHPTGHEVCIRIVFRSKMGEPPYRTLRVPGEVRVEGALGGGVFGA